MLYVKELDSLSADEDSMSDLDLANSVPIGSVWLHHNGCLYTVICVTNQYAGLGRENEYPITVVYQGEDNRLWSKPLSDWYRSRIKIPA